jgi:hypothetical protein
MIPKSGHRFSEKIMLHKQALGLRLSRQIKAGPARAGRKPRPLAVTTGRTLTQLRRYRVILVEYG